MPQVSPGTRFGPYEVLSRLGGGGMGEVYKGRDVRLDRLVAIKVAAEQYSDRFAREARAVAALNHPNICQLYDVGPDHLVMEYIEGTALAPVENTRKLLDIAVQIADGLAAAHAAGIAHRDLKPANILVMRDGRAKILDFGIAKQSARAANADATLTMTITDPGSVLGTPAYMSPEQAKGAPIDARSDQFSFGLIVYEMAVGKRAFDRGSTAETMAAIIREEAPPLPSNLPATLRWTIERCLAKDPAERYDSTRDLWRDLKQAREHLSDAQPAIAGPVLTPQKTATRFLSPVLAAIAGLIAGLAIAVFWPAAPPELPAITPFATEHEIQSLPRWSPKGDRIAYVADVDGTLQVFTKSLGSSTPTQITRDKQSSLSPFWSPDGTRVYYLSGQRPNVSVRSIAVAGGPSEELLDHVSDADLSADGKTLAVLIADASGRYRLAFSSPPGAPPRFYTQAPLTGFYASGVTDYLRFDRSGKYVGMFTGARPATEFWKIPMDGGKPEEMLHGLRVFPGRFAWLTGSSIVSATNTAASTAHLQLVDFASRTIRTITPGASREFAPSVSADGGTLAFISGQMNYEIIEIPLSGGAAAHELVATTQNNMAPAWAPDGLRFVYDTDRSGVSEIWLRNRVDGSERLVVGHREFPDVSACMDSAISPDGSRVAYRAMQLSGEIAIWISPLSGEPPVRLWDDPAKLPQRGPSWSPEGDWIAYYGVHEGAPAVMKARVGGNAAPEFLAPQKRGYPVRWSPRGDWIAFYDGDALRLVSPDAKQNHPLSARSWETYGWSRTGGEIYGIVSTENRRLLLLRVDVATGEEAQIADLGPSPAGFALSDSWNTFNYRGFSLHPDGKSFLTSVYRIKTQIYLMKDFARPARLIDRWWK